MARFTSHFQAIKAVASPSRTSVPFLIRKRESAPVRSTHRWPSLLLASMSRASACMRSISSSAVEVLRHRRSRPAPRATSASPASTAFARHRPIPRFARSSTTRCSTHPDGMPMVWIGKNAGFREMDRVYGPDLLLEVCAASETARLASLFLWWRAWHGGKSRRSASGEISTDCEVAGTHTPPFRPLTPEELEGAAGPGRDSTRPDIFWVGLSTPKQENFMSSNARPPRCSRYDRHRSRI